VGVLNVANLTIANQPGIFGTGGPSYPSFYFVTDLTFKDNNTEYVVSPVPNGTGVTVELGKATYNGSTWSLASSQSVSLPNTIQGLAFDRSTSNTLYAATGWFETDDSGPYSSSLYRVTDTSGSFSVSTVGSIGSYQGVVGLSFANVSSPCITNGIPLNNSVQNSTVTSTVTYKGGLTMTGGNLGAGNFTVSSGGNVQFVAGDLVNLAPGFSVQNGGLFSAVVDPYVCTS
jgi:hypothetical protein